VAPEIERAVRKSLSSGIGILKTAATVGCGSGTVQKIRRKMLEERGRI
jgi:hypothetical protein